MGSWTTSHEFGHVIVIHDLVLATFVKKQNLFGMALVSCQTTLSSKNMI